MSTNTKKEKTLTINVVDHPKFPAVGEVAFTTTKELCKRINNIFAPVFADYQGCNLAVQYMQQTGQYIVVPRLFFYVLKEEAYQDKDKVFAFMPLSANKNGDLLAKVNRISRMAAPGVKVDMTQYGKDGMSDFMITGNNGILSDKFDWTQAYTVIPTEQGTSVCLYKLDILKILNQVWGETSETGSKQFYQITPTYAINRGAYNQNVEDWAINILKLDNDEQISAAQVMGLGTPNYNGPSVVTARV